MGPRHEQEGPRHVDGAAEGHDEEGGPERDSPFIQNLENKKQDPNLKTGSENKREK